MKKLSFVVAAAVAAVLSSCGGSAVQSAAGVDVPSEVKVADTVIPMVTVEGGTFAMGKTPSGVRITGATVHQVVLKGFSISSQRISKGVWKAVMGSDAGTATSETAPVDMVSQDDCIKFLGKLSKMTGIPFSLPTEAQWEYALLTGAIEADASCMEWCADAFVESLGDTLVIDPLCAEKTEQRVTRSYKSRVPEGGYVKKPGLSFRVVVNTETAVPEDILAAVVARVVEREHSSVSEVVEAAGVQFRMIGVKGGAFDMGATQEQGKMAGSDESPVHKVTLSGFEIGQTEVTAGQWLAVMGKLPYMNSADEPEKPVINVSWYDCQEFIVKLNRLTGRKFRLPTEAEWEYAARGGNLSMGKQFAGSNYVSQVAAYLSSASSKVMKVKQFQPNELGLYDMSGNAWEWCQDGQYDYTSAEQNDPCFNTAGKFRMLRGGSAASKWDACRVANRSSIPACNVKSTFGFRLAI